MHLWYSNYRVVEFDIPVVERDEHAIQFNLPDPNLRRYGVTCKWFGQTRYVTDLDSGFLTVRYLDLFIANGDIRVSYRHTLEDAVALCEYCETYDTVSSAWERFVNYIRKVFSIPPKHKTMTLADAKAELAIQMLGEHN